MKNKFIYSPVFLLFVFYSFAQQTDTSKTGVMKVVKPKSSIEAVKVKTHVLYIGIPNTVKIVAPGNKKISEVTISQGSLVSSSGNGNFIANVSTVGEAIVSVYEKLPNWKSSLLTKQVFKVKRILDPIAVVNNKHGGSISKAELTAAKRVMVLLEDFEFEGISFTVTSFNITVVGKGREPILGYSLSSSMQPVKDIINLVRIGDKVYFENIKAVGPGGDTRQLGAIAFIIN